MSMYKTQKTFTIDRPLQDGLMAESHKGTMYGVN
jgi:hypothetical protein